MKISKQQFLDTEDHFADTLRDATSLFLRSYDFGLLPPFRGQRQSCDFEITERVTNQVEVRLRQCNAVTAGGLRIHLLPREYADQLVQHYSFADADPQDEGQVTRYSIVLSVNPYERVPTGVPHPEETPPRHPYAAHAYALNILPGEQVEAGEMGLNHLVIGQLLRQHGRVSVNENYIPPCAAIISHPALIRYYERLSTLLNELQICSFKIIDKVTARDSRTPLAGNIKLLAERMLDYIAQVFFTYRNVAHQQPPVQVISYFSNLAHIFYTVMNYPGAREKEEMLKYFYEWKDVTPGNFEDLLARTVDLVYDHYNIQQSMAQVLDFMQVLGALWNKLSSLEFIGQRRENIVVAEQKTIEQVQARRSWTLLD